MIIRECIPERGLNHIWQASFRDFAIKQSEKLVSMYFSSLLHRVHEFRQRLFSLVTEFMTIPLILEISFVLCLASHNQILTLSFGITNSFTRSCMFWISCCLHWPRILIPYLVWHLCSWIRNELDCELPIAHVILGCQSFPGLCANLDLLSSIGIQMCECVYSFFYLCIYIYLF